MQEHFFHMPEQRYKLYKSAVEADTEGRKMLKQIRAAIQGKNGALTNRYWEALTIFLPQCVYQNPRINVESMVPGTSRSDAIGLKYALEVMCDQQNWLSIWQQMAADALAWRGVGLTTYDQDAPYPRYMEGQTFLTWDGKQLTVDKASKMTIPRMHYIAPERYFRDCEAEMADEIRFEGHDWDESIDLLKAQAHADKENDWIQEAVVALSDQHETGKVKLVQMYAPHFIDEEAVANYRGDEDPKDRTLYTGTIYTMIAEGAHAYRDIRRPRLYRGPAGGLYSVAECVPVPGGGARMAPFAASYEQVDLDARVGMAITKAAASYKRFIVASNGIGEKVRESLQDGIVDVEVAAEFLDAIRELSIGGVSKELLEAGQIAGTSCDRTLGMSDTLRQMAGSDTTATAEQLANQAYNSRTGLYASPIFAAIEKMLSTAGWHAEHSPDFAVHMPDEMVEDGVQDLVRAGLPVEGARLDPTSRELVVYVGGSALKRSDDGKRLDAFDGKTIRLVPMSMSRTNEGLQQKRILDVGNLVSQALQLKAAFPDFDAKRYLDDIGAQLNMPNLGDYMGSGQQPQQAEQPNQMDTNSASPMRQQAQMGVA